MAHDQVKYMKAYRLRYPWFRLLEYARRRCSDENHKSWMWYGGRGIQCTLTRQEAIQLWNRDEGWNLKRPSLDRIDPDSNYCFENCQFIELGANVARRHEPEPTEWEE